MLSEVERLAGECARAAAPGELGARVERHLLSALVCLGQHTLTGHLATAGRQFVDWTADYRLYSRERFDSHALLGRLRQEVASLIPKGLPLVVALDDTRVRKSSLRTAGVSYQRDPLGPAFQVNLILAQRFVQQSMAYTDGSGAARLVPIDFVHAPLPKKPRRQAEDGEWEAYRQAKREQSLGQVGGRRLLLLRRELDEQPDTRERRLVSVVDGGYTNGGFLHTVPERSCVIGRIRSDAKLYQLPPAPSGRGRHRSYGAPAATPEQLRADEAVPWQTIRIQLGGAVRDVRVKTLGPLRWRATGARQDLRLVVIAPTGYQLGKQGRRLYRQPAYLICTDPAMDVAEIVQDYCWRWGIEVNFRDEKTLIGVGQAQVQHPCSVESVPALSVAAYGILLAAALKLYGLAGNSLQLQPPKWQGRRKTRATLRQLISLLRQELWGQSIINSHFVTRPGQYTKCEKNTPDLASALFYGAACA